MTLTLIMVSLLQSAFDLTRLPDCTTRRTIRNIDARELQRAPLIVAAAGVELRSMIGEGQQVRSQKSFESKSSRVELPFALGKSLLRDERIGQAPPGFRVA